MKVKEHGREHLRSKIAGQIADRGAPLDLPDFHPPTHAWSRYAGEKRRKKVSITPEQKQRIAQILKAGWHMLKLIDEIGIIPYGQYPESLEHLLNKPDE